MMLWHVTSPEYEELIDVIDDFGRGPTMPVRDYVMVEADTKREAVVRAVKKMRQEYPHGWHNTYDDENPFKGMVVEKANETSAQE